MPKQYKFHNMSNSIGRFDDKKGSKFLPWSQVIQGRIIDELTHNNVVEKSRFQDSPLDLSFKDNVQKGHNVIKQPIFLTSEEYSGKSSNNADYVFHTGMKVFLHPLLVSTAEIPSVNEMKKDQVTLNMLQKREVYTNNGSLFCTFKNEKLKLNTVN